MSQEVVDCVERSVQAPLALTCPTRPWRAASHGLYYSACGPVHTGSEVGYMYILRVIVRGWTSRSIYSWFCFWLVVMLSTSGFVNYRSNSAYLVSSCLGLSSTRTQSERSTVPGGTDTPSTRLPHPATLRSVKVSGPRNLHVGSTSCIVQVT